jgi:septum site-determining protein MinC
MLDSDDRPETIRETLLAHPELFSGNVILELSERLPWEMVSTIHEAVAAAGGTLSELRPPGPASQPRGETKIITRTIRSGGKVESNGSIVVLGDVNSGAELIASDDIIVLGTLRGLAHAGASGNPKAVIWAQEIRSPQLRIGPALAQAGGDSAASGPEVAQLSDGQIILKPWT